MTQLDLFTCGANLTRMNLAENIEPCFSVIVMPDLSKGAAPAHYSGWIGRSLATQIELHHDENT